MNYKFYIIASALSIAIQFSCTNNSHIEFRPIYNKDRVLIADSVIQGGLLTSIIFRNKNMQIDSIVYEYFENNYLKSQYTFMAGKKVFENIEFYQNGTIKKYTFKDEDNPNIYYEREYFDNGKLKRIFGSPFYQGYLSDSTNSQNFVQGYDINYTFFAPNPPDCECRLFIYDSINNKRSYFGKSKTFDFLHLVKQDNNEVGIFKVDICMELRDFYLDTINNYKKSVTFRVIKK